MPARLMPTFSHVFRIIAYQSVFFPSLFHPFYDSPRLVPNHSRSSLQRRSLSPLGTIREKSRKLTRRNSTMFSLNFAFAFSFLLSPLFFSSLRCDFIVTLDTRVTDEFGQSISRTCRPHVARFLHRANLSRRSPLNIQVRSSRALLGHSQECARACVRAISFKRVNVTWKTKRISNRVAVFSRLDENLRTRRISRGGGEGRNKNVENFHDSFRYVFRFGGTRYSKRKAVL